jgi:hypothetical protein
MSWQAFSWHEIMVQAKVAPIADRLQPAIDWTSNISFEVLQLGGVFLKPLALTQAVLGVWRLGADLGWAGDFFISAGIFSHWQVWIALAAMTQTLAVYLDRVLKSRTATQKIRK